jgi:AcrR family transcriptional regulator
VDVPKLWTETIEDHRQQVRDAILTATAELIDEQGLLSVTMSAIAERTGIGRATLYKYFPDVEAILLAWHEARIGGHLEQLAQLAHRAGDPGDRVTAVLEAYALMRHSGRGQHDTDLAAFLHRGHHLAHAERSLHQLISDLLQEAAGAGEVRDDIPPGELASYCLHALNAASSADSAAAVHRLVALTCAAVQGSAKQSPPTPGDSGHS